MVKRVGNDILECDRKVKAVQMVGVYAIKCLKFFIS